MLYRIIVGVFALVVLWVVINPGTSPNKHYTPKTYTDQANALIKQRLLTVNCPPDGMPQINDSMLCTDDCPEAAAIPESNSPVATESQQQWYKNSYLQEDVRRFNEDPAYSWTFMLNNLGCELDSIHKRTHRISMPFARQDDWQGSIFYNGQTTGIALKSIKRQLTLYRAAKGSKHTARLRTAEIGKSENVAAEQIELQVRRANAASIYHLGNQLVVNNLMRPGYGGNIGLMGYAMPQGRRAWLDTGDWLQIKAGQPPVKEVFVFVDSTPLPVASAMHRRNDHNERSSRDDQLGWFYDRDTDQPIPFVTALAARVGRMLNEQSDERQVKPDFNIQLSINPQLQRTLSSQFHKICDKYRYNLNGGRVFKAGLTVMDGKTGDVLATATYPWPEDISHVEKNRGRMLLNQNFVRHPIGSIMKPFLFGAIADTYPYLATMEINGYGTNRRHKDILYCKVKPGYQIHSKGLSTNKKTKKTVVSRLDFATALALSSNKYTVEMATLALAASTSGIKRSSNIRWPGRRRSGIRIKHKRLATTPDMSDYIETVEQTTVPINCNQLNHMEDLDYLKALERITGVPTYLGLAPEYLRQNVGNAIYDAYTAQGYDTAPLQPLVEYFTGGKKTRKWEVRAMLTGIAPEQVNLGFNYVRNFRQDYISLVLGSGNSVWTNIQVAAAMSNLVTDTRITPHLITSLLDNSGTSITAPAPATERLNLNPSVRKRLLAGLAGVVSRGTGRRLKKPLKKLQKELKPTGYRVFVFSKTGTPTVERTVDRATGKLLKQLHRSYLIYKNGKLQISLAGQTASYVPSKAQGFAHILRKALIKLGYRKNRGAVTQDLMAIFNGFYHSNKSPREATASPLEVVDGRLTLDTQNSVFKGRRRKSWAGGYVFSLVKIPKALIGTRKNVFPTPEQIRDPRTQVLTSVIYLDLPVTSAMAVVTAGKVLKTIGSFNVPTPSTAP